MAKKNILHRSKLKKARVLLEAGQLSDAEVVLEQIIRTERRDADVWLMLGIIAGRQGNHARAAECIAQAQKLRPDDIGVLYNLGIALRDSGAVEAALPVFGRVVALQPGFSDAGACLAHAFMTLGRLEESTEAYRKAIGSQPGNAELRVNLGSVLQARGLVDDAVACYRQALQINPDLPVYDSYGSALTGQGEFTAALAAYREGLRRQPRNARVHSNLLLTMNYMPELSRAEICEAHRDWGRLHGVPQGGTEFHANDRDPHRRLRIGYLSPDFRNHSVAYFIEPLLEAHDRNTVEVFCYSLVPRPDRTTDRLRALADHWRDIHDLTDREVVAQVRADGIDIMVDLAGHTAHNRLTVFALRPAPVQVTYLGYPNTTGLQAIDYRLTDAVADPPDEDNHCTEELVRLPGCFLCYQPNEEVPPVGALPAVSNGYITFGSFNNLAKINSRVVVLWSEVLHAVPGSRLLIKNPSLTDANRRAQYLQLFRAQGISNERLELMGHTPTREEHLKLYSRVDIGLDTFPYNGTTTTCEALWMGVPVLTLAGDRHAGRVGASLLKCVALDAWVADDARQFISIAQARALDTDGLVHLRAGLRERLADSPMCDRFAFAVKVEAAYRSIWRRWCDSAADRSDDFSTTGGRALQP